MLKQVLLSELESVVLPKKKEKCILLFTTVSNSQAIKELLRDDYNFETCLRLLNLKDQLKVRNAKNEIQRNKSLISKLFTKLVLNFVIYLFDGAIELFDPWRDLEMGYSRFGKPQLKKQEKLPFQFNISSSNDILSVVVSLYSIEAIGIDLSHAEQKISTERYLEDFHDIFDPIEEQQLRQERDKWKRYIMFNQFWTLKEAFTKFLGVGLNVDLRKFSFILTEPIIDESEVTQTQRRRILNVHVPKWSKGISLRVQESLLSEYSDSLRSCEDIHCWTSTLQKSNSLCGRLPVIISVISRDLSLSKNLPNYEISMLEVLRHVVN